MKLFKILLFALMPLCALGQTSPEAYPVFNGERKFSGGLVLGANLTQVDGDYLNGYHQVGLNGGVAGYVHFHPRIAASMELLFSQKGSNSVTTAESPYYGTYYSKYRIRLNYAEVPVVLHYLITPRYHLGIGGSYNALIGSREDYNDAGFAAVFDPGKYPFERHTFDGLLSGSVVLWRGLLFNVRYQYSLVRIRSFSDIPPGWGFEDQKNNMFTFRLLYLF